MFGKLFGNDIFATAEKGDIKKLKILIDEKGVDVNAIDSSGQTPLHNAALGGQVEAARFLIEKGANIDARSRDGGITPLGVVAYLAKNGAVEIAKLLIEYGADVNARDMRGVSSLHAAAGSGNIDLARVLIEKGADVNIRDINGSTPLILAVGERQLQVAKLLVEKGTDVNASTTAGNVKATPLHLAIGVGYVPMTKFLIDNGADVNASLRDETGRTFAPLQLALDSNNNMIAELIKKAGGK